MVVPSTAAHASTIQPASSPADCAALTNSTQGAPLCFWVDVNYVGKMGYYYGTGPHWKVWTQNAGTCPNGNWANCASALDNTSGSYYARVWDGDGLHGAHRCLAPGTRLSDLTLDYFDGGTVNMNDAIESNDWLSTSSGC